MRKTVDVLTDVGDADPAHAAHVDARPARHLLADDRAAGSAQRRDRVMPFDRNA
jgi:hypothetical protein